jgi:hypothetical protein
MRWTIFLTAALSSAGFASPTDVVAEASGAALQADEPRALQILQGADITALSEKDRAFVTCMRERFGPSATPPSSKPRSFTDRALAIYQTYWYASLTKPETRDAQERQLSAALRKLLGASKSADLDALLEKRIKADGFHSLEGRTGFLRELMIWGKQDEKQMPVALPEGQYRVRVVLLDGFKSFGWSYYATCGRRATGGWTTDEALYAVVPRYESLDTEEFKVTFLGHEAQHFADKSRFKDLKAWELEYRAKLTELALSSDTRAKVLGKFIEDQGDDPGSPHSYADREVLKALVARLGLKEPGELGTVDLARLQATARSVLMGDSRQRVAAGQLKSASQQQAR